MVINAVQRTIYAAIYRTEETVNKLVIASNPPPPKITSSSISLLLFIPLAFRLLLNKIAILKNRIEITIRLKGPLSKPTLPQTSVEK